MGMAPNSFLFRSPNYSSANPQIKTLALHRPWYYRNILLFLVASREGGNRGAKKLTKQSAQKRDHHLPRVESDSKDRHITRGSLRRGPVRGLCS